MYHGWKRRGRAPVEDRPPAMDGDHPILDGPTGRRSPPRRRASLSGQALRRTGSRHSDRSCATRRLRRPGREAAPVHPGQRVALDAAQRDNRPRKGAHSSATRRARPTRRRDHAPVVDIALEDRDARPAMTCRMAGDISHHESTAVHSGGAASRRRASPTPGAAAPPARGPPAVLLQRGKGLPTSGIVVSETNTDRL